MNAHPAHGPITLRSLRIESLEPRHMLSTTAMTFADDFNRPDAEPLGPDWLEVAGGFDLLNRRAEAVTDSATAKILAADQTHVRAEAFVDVTTGETAGLIARYTNDGSPTGYVGQLVRSAGAVTAQIIRLVDGQETVLSSTPVAAAAGTLRLEVLEQSLDLYFEGKQVGHVLDDAVSGPGATGTRATAGATFDDFETTQIEVTLARGASFELPSDDPYHIYVYHPDAGYYSLWWAYSQVSTDALLLGHQRILYARSGENYVAQDVNLVATRIDVSYDADSMIVRWPESIRNVFHVRLLDLDRASVVSEGWTYRNGASFSIPRIGNYQVMVAQPSQNYESVTVDATSLYKQLRRGDAISPANDTIAGETVFQFDRHEMDVAYFFQLRDEQSGRLTQRYTYSNQTRLTLEAGDYAWRVIPLARTADGYVFGQFSPMVSFTVLPSPLPANRPPTAEAMEITTTAGALRGIVLSATDPDDDQLTFEVTVGVSHGELLANDSGRLRTYRPDPQFVGTDSFFYRAYDGRRYSDPVEVVLQVQQPTNPGRSWYVPGRGTVNVQLGTPVAPAFDGESLPAELIVISGLGQVIDKIGRDGQIQWRYQTNSTFRSVAVDGDQVIFVDYSRVYFLDSQSGRLNDYVEFDKTVDFASPQPDGLLIGLRDDQGQSVSLWNAQDGIVWTNPHDVTHPRWADMYGDQVVIADTFAHRVYGVDLTTDEITFSIDVIYPNDVRFFTPDRLLIVEEHGDRVWTYDLITQQKSWVFGAGFGMQDLSAPLDEIRTLNNAMRIDPQDVISKSKAWTRFSGPVTLYAPNGAVRLPDGSYYIADTDNHRVVHVSADGKFLAQLTGFNNPNKVAIVPSAP